MKRFLCLFITFSFLTVSCSFVKSRIGIKDCEFKLKSVKLTTVDLQGATVLLEISVKNPNDQHVVLDRFDFKFLVEGEEIFQGKNEFKTRIEKKSTKHVALKLKLPYKDFTPVLKKMKYRKFQVALHPGY